MSNHKTGITAAIGIGLSAWLALGASGGCGGGSSTDIGTVDEDTTHIGTSGNENGQNGQPLATDAGPPPPPEDAGPPVDAGPVVEVDAGVPDAGAVAAADPQAAWQALVRRGRQRFMATCDTCHPGGDEDLGPRIIGKNFSIERMRAQIRNGSGRMRPIPARRLSDEDLPALYAFLSTIRAVRGVERPQ